MKGAMIVSRYLLQAAYTPEAWGNLMKNPEPRAEAVRPLVQSLGGSIETSYLSFGEYDTVAILDMPDNVSAAAVSMALAASGALKAVKTSPLLTREEGLEALRKGNTAAATYRPPTA
jgi:uncharacterized protein with GYD domain